MEIYDISLEMKANMIYYADDPTFVLNSVLDMTKGDEINLSEVSMGVHTGTHIDAPLHFVNGGKSITEFPLSHFYGKAKVIDLSQYDFGSKITDTDFKPYKIEPDTILLLKTKNSSISKSEFQDDFVCLSVEAADLLIKLKVKAVGIDYLSIGNEDVHKILLSNEIIVYEGLVLAQILPGNYTFIGFPLKLMGSEGSPTRAVLIR